jgi:hypothetical protein
VPKVARVEDRVAVAEADLASVKASAVAPAANYSLLFAKMSKPT